LLPTRDSRARLAVTGIGVVAPGAIGIDAFREQLRSATSSITTVTRFETGGLSCHKAALVENFSARDFIPPMKLRRMNAMSRLTLAGAKLALTDAGWLPLTEPEAIGVAIGTAFGPVQTSVEYMQEYVEKGPSLAPPQLFAESVANAPGSHVAIEYDLRGFNVTFTQRESSTLAAAMYASSQLLKGAARAAVVGGVEEINEMIFSVLSRVGALAHAEGDHDEAARPFDRRRNGVVLGEGSAILTLETPEAASARNARVYGYFSGFSIGKDTTASVSDWGTGAERVAELMRDACDDAGITPEQLDAVWASANSNVRADDLEARALRLLFGERIPPVVATKGYFGEYAAAGGLQLVSALLGISDQELPESLGFEQADDGAPLPIVTTRRSARLDHLLVNSLSAGGGVICAVLSRSVDG
jgi:3-oxoacyl-[acyl-carrier-protein] synthase II